MGNVMGQQIMKGVESGAFNAVIENGAAVIRKGAAVIESGAVQGQAVVESGAVQAQAVIESGAVQAQARMLNDFSNNGIIIVAIIAIVALGEANFYPYLTLTSFLIAFLTVAYLVYAWKQETVVELDIKTHLVGVGEDGNVFFDTLGLSNYESIKNIIGESVSAGNLKLYVVTLDRGGTRDTDTATMKLILDAVPEGTRYGTIVNTFVPKSLEDQNKTFHYDTLKKFVVFHKGDPARAIILPDGHYPFIESEGWEKIMHFWAYDKPVENAKRFAVGSASGPRRSIIHQMDGSGVGGVGWKHEFVFYAYPVASPGTIRVVVGERRDGEHRMMVNHPGYIKDYWNDENNLMNVRGWTHSHQFWAYHGSMNE